MRRNAPGAACVACLLAVLLRVPSGTSAEAPAPPARPSAPAARVDFNRDVRPILANHCYACHGPDERQRKGDLRLDRKEDAAAVLTPGDPKKSELFARVASEDPSERMPPAKFGKPLSPREIDVLKRWIEQGAGWKGHWSYLPVQRPPLPHVSNPGWVRNPIDAFILARLDEHGLKPSPEADRPTLIRRVTFDLTGLPPTPREVDDFVNDKSPNAYEKVVDRLLQSPHYGERMAVHWLDLARYADTNGYHIDNHRDMWKYREWVINAFNKNVPFDRFTIEQIAGDLLPNATLDQKIASGFNRNTMVNFEGGADPNEYLTKYIVDRVNTTAIVWLGTTLACTECHDHKYDPFTMRDFYSLYAFFNNVPERGLDGQKENPVPSIRVPTKEQLARLDELKRQRAEIEKRIKEALAKVPEEAERELVGPPKPPEHREFVWLDDALPPGAKAGGTEGERSWKFAGNNRPVFSGKKSFSRQEVGLTQHLFTDANPPLLVGEGDKFFAYVWLDPTNTPKEVMLQFFANGSWEHRAYWGENKIDWGKENTPSRFRVGSLPKPGEWVRLEFAAKDVGLPPGARVTGAAFTQFDGSMYWDRIGLWTKTPQAGGVFESQAAWERYEKVNKNSKLPAPLQAAVKLDPAKRSASQKKGLRDHFVQNVWTKTRHTFEPLLREVEALSKAEADLNASVPATMVMEEMPKPRATHILVRGDWQKKGAKVTPATPASLPPMPEGAPPNRLGLAKWLVMPTHPLTSRVTVNRYWEQFFGIGIVRTSEDLGSQGEWPTNPELLDYLASEFMANGWDVKKLVKLLVMSSTYRQSSRVTPEHGTKDPENRLYARGPRFRLPAEMVHDNALAVSGLLDRRVGGPSVRPYQPPGLWEAIAFGGGFSSQTYVQSHGPDLYRRGLYTYWKRSMPHPSLLAFDAPNREVCTDRRPRTNTPLQALVLLNDPIYVEAARVLGQRIMKEGGPTVQEKLKFAFKLCTAREPRPEELQVLAKIYERQLEKYRRDAKAALKLVSVGESPRPANLDVSELAAWTAIGNVLLNLDEVVTKG